MDKSSTKSLLTRKTIWLLLLIGILVVAMTVPLGASAAENGAATMAAAAELNGSAAASRAEFAMLAVSGLGLATVSPSTPTFLDVPRGSMYYQYVEGAHLSGLVQGLGGGYYGPDLPVARQQVATVLARYLSAIELQKLGVINGVNGTYATLAGWYAAEGEAQLAGFADRLSIHAVHRPGVAYLAMHGIALGSNGWFSPLSSVTVAQCVAFVARTDEVADSFSAPPAPAPAVTSISPASGPYAGGTTVYIYGTGFASGATIRFGTAVASSVTVVDAATIVAVSPAGTPGSTVQVSVTTAAGTSANTAADDFTYSVAAAPTITSLSANAGWQGNIIHIYGTNFSAAGLQVWFGSYQVASGNITYYDPTHLAVVVPAGYAGEMVSVRVVTSYGTSANTSADDFTYYYGGLAPSVTSLGAYYGWQGDVISIYGTNFVPGGTAVYFGGHQVPYSNITFYSSSHLAVVVPSGLPGETVNVRVVTDYGTSPNTAADDFTYTYSGIYQPTIVSLSSDFGWEGDVISIYGTNFVEDHTAVYFDSVQVPYYNITYYGSTHLAVVVPHGHAGLTVDVRVVTDYGTSPNTSADDFTYYLTDNPVVTSINPDQGWVGDTVHIYGLNFTTAGLEVWFGSQQVDAGDIVYYNSNHLAALVPAGYGDGQSVHVRVVTDYGTSPSSPADYFTYEGPVADVAALTGGQWSLSGADTWVSSHVGYLAAGSLVDFRAQVIDSFGDPVADTDVSAFSPWLGWYQNTDNHPGPVPAGLRGGEGPVSTVTDANGYLYWIGEGGYSNATVGFQLGFGAGGFGFWMGPNAGTFTLVWN